VLSPTVPMLAPMPRVVRWHAEGRRFNGSESTFRSGLMLMELSTDRGSST
jgi:hypothetical protein